MSERGDKEIGDAPEGDVGGVVGGDGGGGGGGLRKRHPVAEAAGWGSNVGLGRGAVVPADDVAYGVRLRWVGEGKMGSGVDIGHVGGDVGKNLSEVRRACLGEYYVLGEGVGEGGVGVRSGASKAAAECGGGGASVAGGPVLGWGCSVGGGYR